MKLNFLKNSKKKTTNSGFTPSRSRLHASDLHWVVIRYAAFLAFVLVSLLSLRLYSEVSVISEAIIDTEVVVDLPAVAESELRMVFAQKEISASRLEEIILEPVYIMDPSRWEVVADPEIVDSE